MQSDRLILVILFALISFAKGIPAQNDYIRISDDMGLRKISESIYIHISYYDLEHAKHFPANGLIYIQDGKAFIVDTPWTNEETKALISWLQDSLKVNIIGAVVTHWHIDCMGGIKEINNAGIRSYSLKRTTDIAISKNLPHPEITFEDSLILKLGDKRIICHYFGSGHTVDNIIVWLPAEKVMFGGCLIKALNWRTVGNTTEADLIEWPYTLKKILKYFSDINIVIPGHGDYGKIDLIYHTLELLKMHN